MSKLTLVLSCSPGCTDWTAPALHIHSYKLKVDSQPDGPQRSSTLRLGLNYVYRYAMLIVLAEYLLECKEQEVEPDRMIKFKDWLEEKREVGKILSRKTLD